MRLPRADRAVTPGLQRSVLGPILAHLEASYPEEGCGLVFRGSAGLRVEWFDNACGGLAGLRGNSYELDPRQWLSAMIQASDRGEALAFIFHSHCDAPAAFSAMDSLRAAPGGHLLFPGTAYLVVAVRAGQATEARLARWDGSQFVETEVSVKLE